MQIQALGGPCSGLPAFRDSLAPLAASALLAVSAVSCKDENSQGAPVAAPVEQPHLHGGATVPPAPQPPAQALSGPTSKVVGASQSKALTPSPDFKREPSDRLVTASTQALDPLAGCSAAYKDWFNTELKKALGAKDFSSLRQALAAKAGLPNNASVADLQKQLSDPDATTALTQYALLRDLSGEYPVTAFRCQDADKFFTELLSDRELMETILITGLADWTATEGKTNLQFVAIDALQKIWALDPDYARNRVTRNLAAGLAVATTCKNQQKTLGGTSLAGLYSFYRNSWLCGRLDKTFPGQEAWVMRNLTMAQTDVDSLLYAQKNVNLPMRLFSSAHYRTPRSGASIFGDGLGPQMSEPWGGPDVSMMERKLIAGGVCGTQSSLAIGMIAARGIPAGVIGGKGHCAFCWRHPDGYWVGGFGGIDANGHYGPYGFSPSYLYITEAMHKDVSLVLKSRRYAWQAQLADAQNKKALASIAWEQATQVHPIEFVSWHNRLSWLSKNPSFIRQREKIILDLTTAMNKFPLPMFDLIAIFDEVAYPNIKDRAAMLASAHQKAAGNWAPRFMEASFSSQASRLKNNEEKMVLAEAMLPKLLQSPIGSFVLGWSKGLFPKTAEGEKRQAQLFASVLSGLGGSNSNETRDLYNTLIMQAANAGDFDTFNSLAEKSRKIFGSKVDKKIPQFEAFPGMNLGKGGILRLSGGSSTANLHPLVMDDATGGQFMVEGKNAWVAVELPKVGTISGVVVINDGGKNRWARALPAFVEASTDGERWKTIGKMTDAQEVYRFASREKDHFRFVRVRRDAGSEERFHLKGIFIYGEKQQ
ncbi:MAG: hypothetical protein RL095_154 [Verrucomicrobiota bacterium]